MPLESDALQISVDDVSRNPVLAGGALFEAYLGAVISGERSAGHNAHIDDGLTMTSAAKDRVGMVVNDRLNTYNFPQHVLEMAAAEKQSSKDTGASIDFRGPPPAKEVEPLVVNNNNFAQPAVNVVKVDNNLPMPPRIDNVYNERMSPYTGTIPVPQVYHESQVPANKHDPNIRRFNQRGSITRYENTMNDDDYDDIACRFLLYHPEVMTEKTTARAQSMPANVKRDRKPHVRTQKSLVRDGELFDVDVDKEYEEYRRLRDVKLGVDDIDVPRFPWRKYDHDMYDDKGHLTNES